ncbi:MAG: hypothetical protein Q9191_003273 [Dirinaria sp. TL-2023a]
MATQLHSAPNSQASSLGDTIDSQGSCPPQSSADRRLEVLQRENTPSTSLSNPSSQEQIADKPRSPTRRLNLETRQDSAPVAPMVHIKDDLSVASKRTADGRVKEKSSLPTSPITVATTEHSRSSSMTSKGSQIGELSDRLKTRLSYAMVKVQNGWQSRSIDELESMTSQQNSPISTASTLRRANESPRPGSSSTQPNHAGFTQSSERSTATPDYYPSAAHRHTASSGHDYAYSQSRSSAQSPSSANTTRTYESFWREHSEQGTPQHPSHRLSAGPLLAPPADITPRNARRSNVPNAQPPRLLTDNSGTQGKSHTSSVPATPSPQHRPVARTPSQNAAMEKDAVETLMFMSSPKNSGYHPNNLQAQKTPLRNQVAFDKRVPKIGVMDKLPHAKPPSDIVLGRERLKTETDVERLLDEMPDDNSSTSASASASASSSEDDEVRSTLRV